MNAKKYFLCFFFTILVTDLTILLDIPFLRPVLAFLCYTMVPGILTLHILRLYDVTILYKFVVIIGLSISFLLFFGLLVNNLYLLLGLSKPLATQSLVFSLTVILFLLLFIAYKRNENDFQISRVFNFEFDIKKDHLLSLLVFPFLFPFLSAFGTYLMNEKQDSSILLLMLFLIPIYVLAVVYLRRKISNLTYPLALFNITIAILLMHGLTSNYINGRDVHYEYYAFCVVAENLYWSISNFNHAYTACLSTSILPTIYWSLLGVDKLYIYKLYYQLIWATVPLSCYVLYNYYVGSLRAFLSSFLIISQTGFIYTLQSAMRTELAFYYFILVMVTFFNKNINDMNKKILFVIFSFSMILSHYSTSYIFFFFMTIYFVINLAYKRLNLNFSTTLVILIFVEIVFWYGQLTDSTFSNGVLLIKNTFETLKYIFVDDLRSSDAYTIFGSSVTSSAKGISVVIFDIILGVITVGLVSSVMSDIPKLIKENFDTSHYLYTDFYMKYKQLIEIQSSSKFPKEYSLISIIFYSIVSFYILLPFISTGYDPQRLYLQGLLIFAPFFIVGSETIMNFMHKKRFCLSFITLLIISQFFCGTYLHYQLCGIPQSEDLNRKGGNYGEYYIHDQEVIAAKWLSLYSNKNKEIYTDYFGRTRIMLGYVTMIQKYGSKRPSVRTDFFEKNEPLKEGYIYLRRFNVFDGIIQPAVNNEDYRLFSDYSHLFNTKYKLYDNGGSEIWN